MPDIVKLLDNFKEVKQFSHKTVEDLQIDQILKLAQCAIGFNYGINTSILVIKDNLRREKIAQSINKPIIKEAPVLLLFLIDSYKANHYKNKTNTHLDTTLASSLVEIGANINIVTIMAESLGLSSLSINLLYEDVSDIINTVELPEKTLPVFAVCLGYPSDTNKKRPKVPFPIYKHEEKYNIDKIDSYLSDFNEIYEQYLKSINQEEKLKEFEPNLDNLNHNLQKQKITFNK